MVQNGAEHAAWPTAAATTEVFKNNQLENYRFLFSYTTIIIILLPSSRFVVSYKNVSKKPHGIRYCTPIQLFVRSNILK